MSNKHACYCWRASRLNRSLPHILARRVTTQFSHASAQTTLVEGALSNRDRMPPHALLTVFGVVLNEYDRRGRLLRIGQHWFLGRLVCPLGHTEGVARMTVIEVHVALRLQRRRFE